MTRPAAVAIIPPIVRRTHGTLTPRHLSLDNELIEYACLENEKDVPHLVGK